jgi:hypothetical protein
MKFFILALGVLLITACTKPDKVTTTTPISIVQEESIKFTTNIDTGIFNVADTLPLVISVISKPPTNGFIYSITTTWTDSSKQIFKLDTSLNNSILSLNIPGLKKPGNYSLSISVTSKSTASNTLNKSISVVNNILGRFTGYKVDQAALLLSKQKDFGKSYWENTNVLSDLMIGVFQKNYEVFPLPQGDAYCAWTQAICNGDFNNDGYIDVFNAGSGFGGKKANLSFLIWNTASKTFEEKNLINNKTNYIGAPTRVSPVYLNNDNYVDLVIHGHADEGIQNSNEQVTVCISDGVGGYDLTKLELEPNEILAQKAHEHGDVGDLNGDKLPDLLVLANTHTYIFWGKQSFPYFSNKDYVTILTDCAFYGKINDVNKDGYNDFIIGTNTKNQIFINKNNGTFEEKSIPYPTSSTNSMNVFDYVVDDLNSDGLNDIININATNHKNWSIEVYIQKANGSYVREISWIEYTLSLNRTDYRNKLIYYDFDADGKKDLTYSDTGMAPYTSPDNEIKKKTVFIRNGNKFVEKDFFQYDPYAKSLKDKYFK